MCHYSLHINRPGIVEYIELPGANKSKKWSTIRKTCDGIRMGSCPYTDNSADTSWAYGIGRINFIPEAAMVTIL